jgi:hypothetical protein
MNKFFSGLQKFLAGICAIFFVITAGIALIAFNAERRLFNAQLYLHAFENQGLYDQIPTLAAEVLASTASLNPCENNPIACGQESRSAEAQACFENTLGSEIYQILIQNKRTPSDAELASVQPCFDQFGKPEMTQGGGPPEYLKSLSAENWEALISAILPPDISKSLTEGAITSIFDFLNGKTESAMLSLVELKTHLSGPSGVQATMQLLRSRPACTLEDIAQMTFGNLTGERKLILCNPSEEVIGLIEPLIQAELQTVTAGIPDTVTLIAADSENTQNPLLALRVARAILRFSPLLPLGLLFLITVFAVRSLKGWLGWWGIPLFISGLLGIALSIAVNPIFLWAFRSYIAPRFPPALPVSLVDTSRNLMTDVLAGVATPIIFQSIALLLIGMIMILATRINIKAKPSSQPQDTEGEVPN